MITRRSLILGSTAALGAGALGYIGWKTGRIRVGPIDVPDIALAPVPGVMRDGKQVAGFDSRLRFEKPLLINFWASWCPYCRAEHDELMMLANDERFTLVGIVKDDSADKVVSYLQSAGNPFAQLSIDTHHEVVKPMRQRGIPSTLLVPKGASRVSFSHLGPLTGPVIENGLKNALA